MLDCFHCLDTIIPQTLQLLTTSLAWAYYCVRYKLTSIKGFVIVVLHSPTVRSKTRYTDYMLFFSLCTKKTSSNTNKQLYWHRLNILMFFPTQEDLGKVLWKMFKDLENCLAESPTSGRTFIVRHSYGFVPTS